MRERERERERDRIGYLMTGHGLGDQMPTFVADTGGLAIFAVEHGPLFHDSLVLPKHNKAGQSK